VWSILIPASQSATDSLSADLWEMGTAGLMEEPIGLRAFFDDSVEREAICTRFELDTKNTRSEPPFDPSQLKPLEGDSILIGQRFWVAPSWVSGTSLGDRFRLTIDGTSAFGSGRHESTQMCIEVLEKHLKPGDVVLDIGCGSGILGAAATLLGASAVFSCDIHADSVRTARSFIGTSIFVGSADGIKTNLGDFVLANISAKVLDVLAGDLQRITKLSGLIVLGGFIHESPPKRFRPNQVFKKGDWQCWICRPEDVDCVDGNCEPIAHLQEWWL